MTKLEYLKQLEEGLREKITEQEIYDIMRDYAEYFEEGKTEGKTEKEIITSLGDPHSVVSQILDEQENPEMYAEKEEESDDIIGAAKVKFKRIKARMEENKRYNENKKRERESQKQKMYSQSNSNKHGEYKYTYRPHKYRDSDATGCVGGIVLIILWMFIIVPFCTAIFSAGGGLVVAGVGGLIAISVGAAFLVPFFNIAGIFASITMFLAGVTIILLGIMFVKFCIQKTFGKQTHQNIFEDKKNTSEPFDCKTEQNKEEEGGNYNV